MPVRCIVLLFLFQIAILDKLSSIVGDLDLVNQKVSSIENKVNPPEEEYKHYL